MIKLKSILLNELTSMKSPIDNRLRIHLSPKPVENLENKTEDQSIHYYKPTGLWYGFGREWINFIHSKNMKYKFGEYIYFVKIKDRSKLLQIKNFEEICKFTEKYEGQCDDRGWVNWRNVVKDYRGIALTLVYAAFSAFLPWSPAWDVAR